jgi:hypothetical protein
LLVRRVLAFGKLQQSLRKPNVDTLKRNLVDDAE